MRKHRNNNEIMLNNRKKSIIGALFSFFINSNYP